MFEKHDVDKDGMLNKIEIKEMLTEFYEHGKNRKHHEVTDDEIRDFIAFAHRESGKMVTKADFIKFYKEGWK